MIKIKGMVLKINAGVAEIALPTQKKEMCVLIPNELEGVIKVGRFYLFDYVNDELAFYTKGR